MRNRLILCLIVLFALAGCGFANNVGVIGKNLKRLVTPHPYSVDEGEEDEILASGMGIVDMDFGKIGTAWMRINENGTVDIKNYTLTYFELGGTGRKQSQLPPGMYFLNGYAGENMMTGYYLRAGSKDVFGWDEELQEPKCISFVLGAGQHLVLPKVTVTYNSFIETICPFITVEEELENGGEYDIWKESLVPDVIPQ